MPRPRKETKGRNKCFRIHPAEEEMLERILESMEINGLGQLMNEIVQGNILLVQKKLDNWEITYEIPKSKTSNP